MPRAYRSPRRLATAAQTRRDIIEAAIRLHGQGVTDVATLAQEAGVALPTVRKHFPTRERVFEACTAHVAQSAQPFPIEQLAAIEDPTERVTRTVELLFARFEARLGLTWTAYRLADGSAAFAGALQRNQALARRLAEMLVAGVGSTAVPAGQAAVLGGFVQGLLSPLTYRAMRLEGGLDPGQAAEAVARAVSQALA